MRGHTRVLTFELAMRRLAFLAAVGLAGALYLTGLTRMGMVGPDEPRYADVGRAMARSGDWITPRLWGHPWFEKPALLYWMIGAGFRLGLGPELAPRLPVALLSLAFLAFFWWRLRLEWDARVASYATAMLATSAGWLTYSHIAVTDLPLTVFFAAAVLLALQWCAGRAGDARDLTASAACLGLAVLAKGLVPLVLFFPVLVLGWRRWRAWLRPGPILAFSLCAVPWYLLCLIRNGSEFPRVFFVEQQFARFGSPALQHVQPWWFYIPIFLALIYPWFPILALAPRGFAGPGRDARIRVLAVVAAFGVVFFSASVNKLPGYLLPLLPLICAAMGFALARTQRSPAALIASVALMGALPFLARTAPAMLARGLRSAQIPWTDLALALAAAAVAGSVLVLAARARAFPVAAVLAAIVFCWFQRAAFPAFDTAASARPLWLANRPACAPDLPRPLLYGLYYYAERQVPDCTLPDPGGLDRSRTRVVR
jgi:4-amino-4-deoxy-L-arabinose transferase-like glycosyltransferase